MGAQLKLKKDQEKTFCSACFLFQTTSTVLKLAWERLKDSVKNVIFLEYQKSWGHRVEI